jgi:hypothetical protein
VARVVERTVDGTTEQEDSGDYDGGDAGDEEAVFNRGRATVARKVGVEKSLDEIDHGKGPPITSEEHSALRGDTIRFPHATLP